MDCLTKQRALLPAVLLIAISCTLPAQKGGTAEPTQSSSTSSRAVPNSSFPLNLPARSGNIKNPEVLVQRAEQAMEAYRTYLLRRRPGPCSGALCGPPTGDVRNIRLMEPYLSDARAAYDQFLARGDNDNAARSLIVAARIQRNFGLENVSDYTVDQARIAQDYTTALRLAGQTNNQALAIRALSGLVMTNLNSHNYIASAQQADELVLRATSAGTKEDLANAYDARAEVQRGRGNLSAAADDLTRALALAGGVHDQSILWFVHSDRSDLYYDLAMKCRDEQHQLDFCTRALETSLQECEQAVNVAQNSGLEYLAGMSEVRLQQLKLMQGLEVPPGNYEQLSHSSFYISKASQVVYTPQFGQDLNPQRAAALRPIEKQVSGPQYKDYPERFETEGTLLEWEGNKDEALQNYLKAVDLLEKDQRRLGADQSSGQFLSDRITIYYRPAMEYLDRGEYAKAFALLERSRGRAMADLMKSREITLNDPQEQTLFAQSVELEAKLAAAQNKLFNAPSGTSSDDVETLQHTVDELQAQHRALEAKIAEKAPRLHELVEVTPISLAQAQAAAKRGGYDILYYLVLDDGLLIWHIGGDSQHAVKVYYTRPLLIPRVTSLYKSISDPHFAFDQKAAEEFWLVLINPVLPHITTKHLVIIPHEELNALPFQVFRNPSDGTYLGERFQISYAPSATVLGALGTPPDFPRGRLLALADPHISSAVAEVTALGALYPPSRSKIVPSPLPRKQDVMDWSPGYNLLHLSVHGHFDSLNPMLSYLELRPTGEDDGHFTAAEMFGLRLPRNSMVVLSACETGRVQVTHSNEVLGMVRGLLYAGASNLVLSSWSVDAEATALWMKTFYREAQTKSPSEAAQLALLAVKVEPKYQHPFYWAPFELTGR